MTAQGRLTLEESVACLSISDGPPSGNLINSSHGDQGPGSKPAPTSEGDMDPMECWHWRDPKPDFSDDDTLDMVASPDVGPLYYGSWELEHGRLDSGDQWEI